QVEAASSAKAEGADPQRAIYNWTLTSANPTNSNISPPGFDAEPDIAMTTFSSWRQLSSRLRECLRMGFSTATWAETMKRIGVSREPAPAPTIYDFASKRIATVDLPPDFAVPLREASEILASGYARPEEKIELLLVLLLQNSPKF